MQPGLAVLVNVAQQQTMAADVATWARRKAELAAKIEAYEGLVSDARAHAQLADVEQIRRALAFVALLEPAACTEEVP